VINLWNIPNSNPITIPVEMNKGNNIFISYYLNFSFIRKTCSLIGNKANSSFTLTDSLTVRFSDKSRTMFWACL
jgi:hypothetical protein